MKEHLKELIHQALCDLRRKNEIPDGVEPEIVIERARSKEHGDFASNIALVMAKPCEMNPRQLAEAIVSEMNDSGAVDKVEIAGPGFINFYLSAVSLHAVVTDVLGQGEDYGRSDSGEGLPVTVEFVSANPTGPLHVGHGRGAAYGATLSNLLDAVGFEVQREYYVNDFGRQMRILGVSVWLRYLELCGEQVTFHKEGYKGEYIYDIARKLRSDQGDELRRDAAKVGEHEEIDSLIECARELLGEDGFQLCLDTALDHELTGIRNDLKDFGVEFDNWFSEKSLADTGAVDEGIERLRSKGLLYEKDGAQWFRATDFGDDKDRVVVRENGTPTYFASDVAYMNNKLKRGFKRAIYVFGADHHGYVSRLQAVAKGLEADVEILLIQFAVLYRDGEKVQMSTRSGEFVTLRELFEEVGVDAGRYFYVMRAHEQHMDFDLDLAKSKEKDNPVYYVQYAHARVCSVFRELGERQMRFNRDAGEAALDRLENDHEQAVMTTLQRFPDTVESAARNRAPQHVAHYLHDLSSDFQSWYQHHKFIVDDADLRNARLCLADAVRQVIANGLKLLGVGAPERM